MGAGKSSDMRFYWQRWMVDRYDALAQKSGAKAAKQGAVWLRHGEARQSTHTCVHMCIEYTYCTYTYLFTSPFI